MSICKKCGKPKDKICRPCKSASDKRWRDNNKEKVRAYFKKRWLEPERKAANKLYKNRGRFGIDADSYVLDKACEGCGKSNNENIEEYGRRLDINHIDNNGRRAMRMGEVVNNSTDNFMVMCRSCHTRWHNKNIRDYNESNKSK